MVRVCESNILFLRVRPCVHLSVTSISVTRLLNHWADFNQTCFITSSHAKGMRGQNYFFPCVRRPCIRRPSISLSRYFLLNHWAEFNQTCYFASPNGKDVQEQLYFSVRPSMFPSIRHVISSKPLDGSQPNLLHHALPLMVRVERSTLFYHTSIRSCVRRPSICPLRYLFLHHWAKFNQTGYIIP